MQHDTPHTWWVHLTSGQKGQMAVGEKGKQLAELAPCTFAACDRSQLAATFCREHVPKLRERTSNFEVYKLAAQPQKLAKVSSYPLAKLQMYFRYFSSSKIAILRRCTFIQRRRFTKIDGYLWLAFLKIIWGNRVQNKLKLDKWTMASVSV